MKMRTYFLFLGNTLIFALILVVTLISRSSSESLLDSHADAAIRSMDLMVIGTATLALVLGSLMMFFIGRRLLHQLGGEPSDIAIAAQKMAVGDLQVKFSGNQGIAASFAAVVAAQREVARQLKAIASGDYDRAITPRSDKDELSHSLLAVQASLRSVCDQANTIASGDYSANIAPRSDKDELGIALCAMTAALRKAREESSARDWLKIGISRLISALQGNPSLDKLISTCITELTTYLEAQVGALYLVLPGETQPVLSLQGSYAYSRRKNLSNRFMFGEGLVGQAALERQPILVRNVPEDYVHVVSGLGESVPRFICVTPFLYKDQLKGVIEIGTLGEFAPLQMEYLAQAMQIVAIAVESAQARNRQAELLEESQRLTEELQAQQEELRAANRQAELLEESQRLTRELRAQQEELRATNEELEDQSKRLQASEELLRAQQEEIEASNEELEEKNELLERQKREVEQAKKVISLKADELAVANKYKSEFLANMSHELRTPLNSLLLLSQSLAQNKTGNLSLDQIEMARIIHSSGSDLLNLINEILDLSKIEAGHMDLQIAPVRLSELVEDIQASFGHMATQKGLSLGIRIADDLPASIRSDRKRLDQILRNLISNAIKFTKTGGVTVHIAWPHPQADLSFSRLAPTESIAIAVTDTGIGIAEDKHGLIFEAFQQADGSTSRLFGGTGLGLTISRELASLLGGEIQLHSQPDRGATFTLYLPLTAVARSLTPLSLSDTLPSARIKTSLPVSTPAPTSPTEYIADDRATLALNERFILVIEDDPKFAAILVDKCRQQGIKCVAVASGESGLDIMARQLPCGIILDIWLPGMDGMAVLNLLKNDTRTRHIPIHIVSVDDRGTEPLLHGAIGHAVKPLGADRLESIIKTLDIVATTQSKRVLVVEDSASVRREAVELLTDSDVEVDEAATGVEAMEKLHQKHYDCVVLDLKLPDMDGQALLNRLAREGVAIPPIVVHTPQDLTSQEKLDLHEQAQSIVIKDVHSPERLLDEVTLFLHRVVSQMPESKRRIISNLYDSDALFRDKKVLIADDDMRSIFALSRLLADRGFQPLRAENGAIALQLLAAQPNIDIVLMDIMMPQMDGYEAIQRIRAQEPYKKLPIIALTAKAMPADRQKCIDAGASDYLSKPIDADRLLSMMRLWLYR